MRPLQILRCGTGAALLLSLVAACDSSSGGQAHYDTPEEAGAALISAVEGGDTAAMLGVLGEDAQPVVESGDAVADANNRAAFLTMYGIAHRWENETSDASTLIVGEDDWPFPFPLVKEEQGWRFDTSNGIEEVLDRRVGENELAAIQAALAYVDAQREYYWWNPDAQPLLHYARYLVSSEGRKDGLYWDAPEGEAQSPLGELFAAARAEGYLVDGAVQPVPYYGYHFRMLLGQGEHAQGGAYDYLVGDRLVGGFALVAYPAERGSTGVMTFIVNHDGVVFSKDLGPDTQTIATEMTVFDPDATWKREN